MLRIINRINRNNKFNKFNDGIKLMRTNPVNLINMQNRKYYTSERNRFVKTHEEINEYVEWRTKKNMSKPIVINILIVMKMMIKKICVKTTIGLGILAMPITMMAFHYYYVSVWIKDMWNGLLKNGTNESNNLIESNKTNESNNLIE
jgi:hypothetical protein